jgi:cytochrome c-type biogenesis protein CcmH/NrfG
LTWLQLGEYDLQVGNPQEAMNALQAALYLGPFVPETQSAAAQAQSAAAQATSAVQPAATAPGSRATAR